MSPPLVLIVEDAQPLAVIYAKQLERGQFASLHADTLARARVLLPDAELAAVLLDLELPDGRGIDLLQELRDAGNNVPVVVVTAHGSVEAAVEAMRAGADDFLTKPIEAERLLTTLRHVLERKQLLSIVDTLRADLATGRFEGFIGSDLSMQAVYRVIEQAARSSATVFITGESGTGKEVTAEAIHRRSERRNRPFVAVNCGAIPKELMESELFGHVRGAFTGATTDRAGLVVQADGGTLFLDEIGDMELALQVKLLRFLQTGVVQPVGSDRTRSVNVRIVCATNRDPLAEVQAGRFREDLYYRLYVLPIELPPLRKRGRDVVLIANHFLAEYGVLEGRRFHGFTPEVEALLRGFRWPGNIRQLQNMVRSIVVMHDAELVTPDMLPAWLRTESAAPAPSAARPPPFGAELVTREVIRPLAEVERDTIERAVALCGGNLTEAANRLGINVSTIHRKRQHWRSEEAG
nr:sigma-54 dependent transcriptional regulator [Azospirillum soli]